MDLEPIWGTLRAANQYTLDGTPLDNLEKPESPQNLGENMQDSKQTITGAQVRTAEPGAVTH